MDNLTVSQLLDIANKTYTEVDIALNTVDPNTKFGNALG